METENNSGQVAQWMNQLNETGVYNVGKNLQSKILQDFFGTWVDEFETKETIGNVYRDEKYLMDPHTAVAWRAMEKYRLLTSDDTYCIVLSTASPFKFSNSVLEAIKPKEDFSNISTFSALNRLAEISGLTVPPQMAELENLPVLHEEVIEKTELESTVKKILGI